MKIMLSVITPTYNRKAELPAAITSVKTQRTKWRWELIISDDGSTDGTEQLFKKKDPRIRYFKKPNGGVNAARNRAIKASKGEYLVFLDSDDTLTPDCFATIERYAKARKLGAVNLFSTVEKSGKRMTTVPEERNYTYKEWLAGTIDGEFLSVVRRDVFKQLLFDEERFAFERFFWNRAVKQHGCFASPIALRTYSYDAANRVSPQLLSVEKAEKRYEDYQRYIAEFGNEYLGFGLKQQYADLLLRAGLYAGLAGKRQEGLARIKGALRTKLSITGIGMFLLLSLGTPLFRTAYRLMLKLRND